MRELFQTSVSPILWGGATASGQYEGGFREGGRGMDTQDCRPYLPRTSNATTATRLLTGDAVRRAKEDTRDFQISRVSSFGGGYWASERTGP